MYSICNIIIYFRGEQILFSYYDRRCNEKMQKRQFIGRNRNAKYEKQNNIENDDENRKLSILTLDRLNEWVEIILISAGYLGQTSE